MRTKSLRWHWGMGIAAVYLVFAAATVGFAVFAMEQRVDLVSPDYYEQALAQDRRAAAAANAASLGAAFRMDVGATGRHVTITWPLGTAIEAGGTVTLYRPSDQLADRVLPAVADDHAEQVIELSDVRAGRWILQVHWRSHGREYFAERTLIVP